MEGIGRADPDDERGGATAQKHAGGLPDARLGAVRVGAAVLLCNLQSESGRVVRTCRGSRKRRGVGAQDVERVYVFSAEIVRFQMGQILCRVKLGCVALTHQKAAAEQPAHGGVQGGVGQQQVVKAARNVGHARRVVEGGEYRTNRVPRQAGSQGVQNAALASPAIDKHDARSGALGQHLFQRPQVQPHPAHDAHAEVGAVQSPAFQQTVKHDAHRKPGAGQRHQRDWPACRPRLKLRRQPQQRRGDGRAAPVQGAVVRGGLKVGGGRFRRQEMAVRLARRDAGLLLAQADGGGGRGPDQQLDVGE